MVSLIPGCLFIYIGQEMRKSFYTKIWEKPVISLALGMLKWIPGSICHDWTSWQLLINFLGVFHKTSRFANTIHWGLSNTKIPNRYVE